MTFAAVAISQLGFIVTSQVLTRASELAKRADITAAGKASYDNAFLLFMLPHSLITVSLTTALFVRLANAARRGDTREVVADLGHGLRAPAPLTVPIAIAGFATPSSGRLLVAGREVTHLPPDQRGMARSMLRERKAAEEFENWSKEVRGRAFVEMRDEPN